MIVAVSPSALIRRCYFCIASYSSGKNIHFGDDGKLTFDVNTGDIKSEQMAAMTTESARQADEIIMLKADNARQADTSARQADTIIMLEANAVLQAAEIASLKQGAGNQKDVVNESTGVVTASDAFCAVSYYTYGSGNAVLRFTAFDRSQLSCQDVVLHALRVLSGCSHNNEVHRYFDRTVNPRYYPFSCTT